ncbi:alpha/beta fold hydrolase [Hoeflea sp. TYP-13]|uniref:alpha/beta fold hydrolase n=1 Tax=Hoeflea sp. TYP-13 TaxID=3230023 RepID=UPI0034C5B910
MTSLIQKVIHFGFDITGRLAPETAGRVAFRLFCTTPSRKPASKKARLALEQAGPAMAGATKLMLPIHGGRVATWYFPANGAANSETVLITHGWGARTEHMLDIVKSLQKAGKAVVALDLPGHGASSGRTLNMALAVEAVDAAWRQYGPFSMMLGHSFGGAVVLNAAVGSVAGIKPNRPDRIVLISAPNAIPAVFEWFAGMLGLRPKSRRALFERVEQVTGRPLESFMGTVQLAALKKPALIIHAREDREVTVDHAEGFMTAGRHVEVLWADGYGHRRILKAPEVVQAVTEFADGSEHAKAA